MMMNVAMQRFPAVQTMQAYPRNVEYGDYEEDEDDDEDDDQDDDEEVDMEGNLDFSTMAMSASLRKALGLDYTETKTDWKPPEFAGLSNSAPFVNSSQKANNVNSTTFYGNNIPVQDEEDYEDDDDDDDDYEQCEDEIENYDQSIQRMMNGNLSPDLMRLLNPTATPLAQSTTQITDWKPPSRPGLSNSLPIISKNNPTAVNSQNFGVTNNNLNSTMNKAPSFRNNSNLNYIPTIKEQKKNNSSQRSMNGVDNGDEEEDDDEDEDEDEEDIDTRKDISEVPMSASLRKALGFAPMNFSEGAESSHMRKWEAPKYAGLSNSTPLVSPADLLNKEPVSKELLAMLGLMTGGDGFRSGTSSLAVSPRSEYDPTSQKSTNTASESIAKMTAGNINMQNMQNVQQSSLSAVNNQAQEGDEEDEEEYDDEDEEYEDEEDDEAYGSNGGLPSGAMSLGLMKALGLNTDGMEIATDWKPPAETGLHNSKPIVERKKQSPRRSKQSPRNQR